SHFTMLVITNSVDVLTALICKVLLPKFAWATRHWFQFLRWAHVSARQIHLVPRETHGIMVSQA
ncbi:hypothetical protein RYX36_033362, partial [Vicia faba]